MTFTFGLEFLRNTFPVSVVNTSPSLMQLLPPHPVPSSTAVPSASLIAASMAPSQPGKGQFMYSWWHGLTHTHTHRVWVRLEPCTIQLVKYSKSPPLYHWTPLPHWCSCCRRTLCPPAPPCPAPPWSPQAWHPLNLEKVSACTADGIGSHTHTHTHTGFEWGWNPVQYN